MPVTDALEDRFDEDLAFDFACATNFPFQIIAKLGHEPPINPVFQPPQPTALGREGRARCHRMAIAGRNQGESMALRDKWRQWLARQCPSQIVRQGHTFSDRIDSGLGQRVALDRRNVTGREHVRMGY